MKRFLTTVIIILTATITAQAQQLDANDFFTVIRDADNPLQTTITVNEPILSATRTVTVQQFRNIEKIITGEQQAVDNSVVIGYQLAQKVLERITAMIEDKMRKKDEIRKEFLQLNSSVQGSIDDDMKLLEAIGRFIQPVTPTPIPEGTPTPTPTPLREGATRFNQEHGYVQVYIDGTWQPQPTPTP